MCRETFLPPSPYPWATQERPIRNWIKACNFLKKRLQRRCFPLNILKFLRTPILKNFCERLLLNIIWKRCWKYAWEWLKKDLAAQEVEFKFLKTLINILWYFRFIQYSYCLNLLKVCEIFFIHSSICNIAAQKNITCQK